MEQNASPLVTLGQQRQLAMARWLARSMDTRWGVGPVRFGAETILNLIPVVGGLGSVIVSVYQLLVAIQLTLPPRKLVRMLLNIVVDGLCGLVPFLGDLVDAFFRVHVRNQRIIDGYMNTQTSGRSG